MEVKQNPFSVYDFLGYLIPGAFFIYVSIWLWPALGVDLKYLPSFDEKLFKHPDLYIPFVIAAYVAGHALSFLASMFVERYVIWVFGYPSQFLLGRPSKGCFASIPKGDRFSRYRKGIRGICAVVGAPYSFSDWFMQWMIGGRELYAKALDRNIIALIERKLWIFVGNEMGVFRHQLEVDKDFKGTINFEKADYFRAVYHYCLEKFPLHLPSLKNYVSLYGFLRTMTFLFTVLFWIGAIKVALLAFKLFTLEDIVERGVVAEKLAVAALLAGAAWVCTYVFFMAFVKFYRRFTLEAFMALAANYSGALPKGFEDPYAVKVCD